MFVVRPAEARAAVDRGQDQADFKVTRHPFMDRGDLAVHAAAVIIQLT